MDRSSFVLFPHSFVSEPDLKRILSLFGGLIICQPWFMEDLGLSAENPTVRVVHPPDDAKPGEDFKRVFSEYKAWVSQNRDKGYTAFLAFTRDPTFDVPNTWNIRQTLRHMDETASAFPSRPIFKWHLFLHLAGEYEESRMEEEKVLSTLRQKSPLQEALGDESPPVDLFRDLPSSESFYQDDHHVRQVLEAWFGLFEKVIPNDALLLTLDPSVFNYASDLFELPETQWEEASRLGFSSSHAAIKIRDFASIPRKGETLDDPVPAGLSSRKLIFLERSRP